MQLDQLRRREFITLLGGGAVRLHWPTSDRKRSYVLLERAMDDDHPHLEKKMGHKPYGDVPRLAKIAMWLVLIAIACGLILYLAVWTNLIQ
jgi:hypothetical protein